MHDAGVDEQRRIGSTDPDADQRPDGPAGIDGEITPGEDLKAQMLRRCIAHQGTRNRFIDGSCDGGNDVRQREGGDRLRQSEPRQRQPGHEKRCGQHPFSADAIGQRAGKGADDCAEQRAGADQGADAGRAEPEILLQADRQEGQAHALGDRHHAGAGDE
ncbi:hypothetical protein D9M70_545740 [compost metagenome]